MSVQTAAPRRGNLARMIPTAQVGPGGDLLSPDEIKRRRALLAQRQQDSRGFKPIKHWGEGAAMLVDAVSDAFEGRRLSRAEEAGLAEDKRLRGIVENYASGGSRDPVAAALVASGGFEGAAAPRSSGAASLPSGDLASYTREGLVSRGLPSHVADGFLANFQDESGFNPGINEANPIVPGSRGGFGLYQLTGPRRVAYEQFAAQRGVAPDDVDAQLDFLAAELGLPGTGLEDQPFFGSESRAAERILSAPDTATAAQAIVGDFLRPSPEHRQSRSQRYANLPTADYQRLMAGEPRERPSDYTAAEIQEMAAYRDPQAVSYDGPGQTYGAGDIERLRNGTAGQLSLDTAMSAMAVPRSNGAQVASLDPSAGMQPRYDAIASALTAPESRPSSGGMTAQRQITQALATGSSQPQASAQPAQRQIAQALFPSGGGGISPALLEAATSPYASESTRSVAQALMQSEMQRQNWMMQQDYQRQAQESDPLRQIQIQAAQQELARGQAPINVGNGYLYKPDTGEWITAPGVGQASSAPDAFQTLALRAQAAGLQEGTPEYQSFMANGGRSAEDSAAEQRIGRLTENLMATGAILDPTEAHNLAVGMVDGRYQQARDPITGNLQIVDTATGSVMFDGRNTQGGQPAPNAMPSDPAMAPAPAPSEFGERYPNAPDSFGVSGAAQRAMNTVGDAVGFGAPYPDVQQTQASFGVLRESLLNDVAGAYGRQPPSWLLQEIRGLTPEAGSPFQGAGGAVVKLQALGNHLQTELQLAHQSSGRDMNPERQQALQEKIIGLEAGLGRIRQALGAFQPASGGEPASGGGDGSNQGGGVSDGMTATNPQTGERIIFRNGQWEPMQ